MSTWTPRKSATSCGVFVTALAGRFVSYFSTDITTKFSFLFQKTSFFSPPPDRHLTALWDCRHHRLRHASRQQRLRQRGRGQHQGHSEGRSPGGGGHSGGKCLKNSCFKIQIYALLADGGEDAPEHKRMASLLWYTNYCAKTPDKKITHILSFSVTLFSRFLFSKVQS